MTKAISLLGSTGSIGRQTLDVCAELGIRVAALAAYSNTDLLEQQTRQWMPRLVVLYEETAAEKFRERISDLPIPVLSGVDGLIAAASLEESDTVVTAVVGMVGLRPTLAAIEKGKRIALANKETLVCAGELVMQAAQQYGAEIIPVDSEHSAIFQCLQGCHSAAEVKRLLLTCSGGPFFSMTKEEVDKKTKADALRHPNWKMGEKITIDCATLMNKGLEFIEAMRLFAIPAEQISVVIHRQSIIHSMVEYRDGSVIAQMGTPDMRLPIRYALTYPARAHSPLPPLDLLTCPPLTFHEPDTTVFPALRLAMECANIGGTSCAILNGANEEAVGLFLREQISFGQIPELVAHALDTIPVKYNAPLSAILEADQLARLCVRERC